MIIDLIRLNNRLDTSVEFDFTYSFGEEFIKDTDIISLDNVEITGNIVRSNSDIYNIYMTIKGVMVLPCAITLKPVNYPFEIKIDDDLDNLIEEFDKNIKKDQNTIDILPIIWENILMEIPMRVVSEDAKDITLKGDGWRFITDQEDQKSTNPELKKLEDLL